MAEQTIKQYTYYFTTNVKMIFLAFQKKCAQLVQSYRRNY